MSHDDAHTSVTPAAVSRRNFIKGVVAGSVAVSSAAYLFRDSPLVSGQAARTGSVERLLTLTVNGQTPARGRGAAGDAGHHAPLQARADRHQAGLRPRRVRRLHGARRRRAAVLVLGAHPLGARDERSRPSRAWRPPTARCTRCSRAWSSEQGFQCAFCMSGFIMATVGFLKKNPTPTREELAHGVSGNLCRCQDYDKILTALASRRRALAGGDPWLTPSSSGRTTRRRTCSPRSPAARSTPRTSAPTACSSRSCCSARCRTRACAASTRRAAEAMPGVKAILRAGELPAPADTVTDLGETIRANPKGEKALTDEPVYAGEPVLAVAAVDEETACRGHRSHPRRLGAAALRGRSAGVAAARRAEPARRGQHLGPAAGRAGQAARSAARSSRSSGRPRTSPSTTRARCRWASRRSSGRTATSRPASRRRRSCSTRPSRWPTTSTTCWSRARRWPTGERREALRAHRHAERGADRGVDLAVDEHAGRERRAHHRVHRRRLRQPGHRRGASA